MKVPSGPLKGMNPDTVSELRNALEDLEPGLYVAGVDTGHPGYRTLSAALADALGWSRPAGYETMVTRLLETADALAFPTAETFELNEPAEHALKTLSSRVPVLAVGPGAPRLTTLGTRDITRDIDLPASHDRNVPMAEGTTKILLEDPKTASRGVAAGALLALALRVTTGSPDEFWTLTAIGLGVLAISRLV